MLSRWKECLLNSIICMKGDALFSIVIPTYNRAGFISQTVISVLNQSCHDFEVIVVDDGGTDETDRIIAAFNEPRIRYFKTPNRERGAARNFGIDQSRGQYVTFLDSDDLLKPNHVFEASRFIRNNPEAVVFGLGYDIVAPDGRIVSPFQKLPDPVNEKLCEGNFLSCIGVFVKRTVISEIRFNEDRELSGSEDYELWLRLAARYPIRTVPIVTSAIVNHETRSVLDIDIKKFERRRQLLKDNVWNDARFVNSFGRWRKKVNGYMDLYAALHLAMGSFRIRSASKLFVAFIQHPPMVINMRFWVVIKKLIVG